LCIIEKLAFIIINYQDYAILNINLNIMSIIVYISLIRTHEEKWLNNFYKIALVKNTGMGSN